jgi:hypothetical protein
MTYVSSVSFTTKISNNGVPGAAVTNCLQQSVDKTSKRARGDKKEGRKTK